MMLTPDLVEDLLRANILAGAAVLLVLLLRVPARRLFGAQEAYALWATPPLVFLASLAPAAEAECLDAAIAASSEALLALPALPWSEGLLGLWATGAGLALGLMVVSQLRFLAAARAGRAGPAVVGVLLPRLVTPDGFEAKFSEAERRLIRAHERAHIERNDPRANAMMALVQLACWFNPLIHLGAYFARLDQELACDATVMSAHGRQRRLYAQTMLKTNLAVTALPFGCRWVGGAHPLETRIAALAGPDLEADRRLAGGFTALILACTAAWGAWALKPPVPPRPRFTPVVYVDGVRANVRPATVVMIRLSATDAAGLPRPAQ